MSPERIEPQCCAKTLNEVLSNVFWEKQNSKISENRKYQFSWIHEKNCPVEHSNWHIQQAIFNLVSFLQIWSQRATPPKPIHYICKTRFFTLLLIFLCLACHLKDSLVKQFQRGTSIRSDSVIFSYGTLMNDGSIQQFNIQCTHSLFRMLMTNGMNCPSVKALLHMFIVHCILLQWRGHPDSHCEVKPFITVKK